MGVEGIEALLGGALHNDAPAAFERLFQERRQHILGALAIQLVT
jgi:hypothetical protein